MSRWETDPFWHWWTWQQEPWWFGWRLLVAWAREPRMTAHPPGPEPTPAAEAETPTAELPRWQPPRPKRGQWDAMRSAYQQLGRRHLYEKKR